MLDITKDNFESEVKKSSVPVVIDFWAAWCGPCRIFSPVFEELAKQYDKKIKFVKLNVDDNPEIASEYNVMSIPTALLFDRGDVKAMSVGALPKEDFKKWLEKNL